MAIGKNDQSAQLHWGHRRYEGIPKNVFAVVAWHLANACAQDGQTVADRFAEEIDALVVSGLLDPKQERQVLKLLERGRE